MISEYTVIKFEQNILFVQANDRTYSIPLFLTDGKYPEGEELKQLILNTINNTNMNQVPQVGTNLEYIESLITAPVVNLSKEALSRVIRSQRAKILLATDWTQMPDSPLDTTLKTSWAIYRNMLRDLTKQNGFPMTITWPLPPSAVTDEYGLVLTTSLGIPTQQ